MKHHNKKDCFFQRDIKIIFTDSNRAAETVCGGGASWALVILWVDDEDANHTFLKSGKKLCIFLLRKNYQNGQIHLPLLDRPSFKYVIEKLFCFSFEFNK